ncbi:MAG: DNA mismatch endonuclease Vsr [Xanthobacteraceae bacterium]|nr:DNA mismatch endonuclease Vsr [Xanthobacteraceae bacterium]QYK45628.1 MAG: DNA mismatch endonuclease Vsr [Xanthobacteraceae bacterium]
MADVFSRSKRSEIMSRVKGHGNALTELRLLHILREKRLTGWRRKSKIIGRPDFIFRAERVAVFVDGCFWHGCPKHGSIPKTNEEFWSSKLKRNRQRDREVSAELRRLGWTPVRIWQHELKNPDRIARRIATSLRRM